MSLVMKPIKTMLIVSGLIFFISGCYKAGCTDPAAVNYDSEVKKEDLSCSYNGNLVFWESAFNRDSLINLGHEMLRFELEGEIVDSIATSGFASVSEDCNASGTKTFSLDFDGHTERHYKYRVKGFEYETLYEGFVTVLANDCVSIHLD